ncbi:SMP-30/gluconolactonase/LRE family protein [Kriegella aquimaris]|uniref:Sugar lactone lactonase YvrE n=1 Tax=Kriegella aquimaris TaxID=192904 RepID=A0A1G9Y9S2_9FLAO|nr:SMP-30/gluconolactonase/LRE family protein [Kriegella aquimaris]SDN05173.1 Sugar lactone lactonase YvrE [Kriegella aquimaris]
MTKANSAQLVYDAKAILGEGPVWDPQKQLLFWVDIEGKKLHQHNPTNTENRQWSFDGMIGATVPAENGNLILALESGLTSFNKETEELLPLNVLENSNSDMRFNDGKVGPNGNFWIGSMHKKFVPKSGNLYRVDRNYNANIQISETTISNGMAWTADKKTFYYIDSDDRIVYGYDFDSAANTIANKRIVISVPEGYGSPDGMSIDVEGMLWIAHWGGNCVRRWNPDTAEVLEKVAVDAPHVTSCCFGGKDLNSLYITSARSDLNEKQLQEFPKSGGLFVYRPKVKGTPITLFKNT